MRNLLTLIICMPIYAIFGLQLFSCWAFADSGSKCLNLFAKKFDVVYEINKKLVFAHQFENTTLSGGDGSTSITAQIYRSYQSWIREAGRGLYTGALSDPNFIFPSQKIIWEIPNSDGFTIKNTNFIHKGDKGEAIYKIEMSKSDGNSNNLLTYETRYVLKLPSEINPARALTPYFKKNGITYVNVHNVQLQLHYDIPFKIENDQIIVGERTSLSLWSKTYNGNGKISVAVSKYRIINHLIDTVDSITILKKDVHFPVSNEDFGIHVEATSMTEFALYTYNYNNRNIKRIIFVLEDNFSNSKLQKIEILGTPENLPEQLRKKLFVEITESYS